MAGARNYAYEYETSPRKLKPVETPKKQTPKKKKSTLDTKKQKQEEQKKLRTERKKKVKLVFCICAGFAILFAISYRYSLISEQFAGIQKLKKELSTIQKENEKLEVKTENELNLNNIEQSAKEKLGMQKLDNKQMVYVTLDKKDYVESAAPQIVKNSEESFFNKAINTLKQIFK